MKTHPADLIAAYNRLGVRFVSEGATVLAVGAGVAPVLAGWVAEHSTALLPWLHTQTADATVSRETLPAPTVQPSRGDALLWASLQGARRAAERKAAIVRNAKARRRGVAGR
jgi:hypothetical protein